MVRVTSDPGHTFLDRMIALVEGAERQKTPNEIALEHPAGRAHAGVPAGGRDAAAVRATTPAPTIPIPVLIALLVCLIPTTIGALISAIGIAGMDRLVQHNVLAMSGRAVEAAGDVDTLLLDKTGTITLGNRQATEFRAGGRRHRTGARRRRAAGLARRRDARGPVDRRAGQGEVSACADASSSRQGDAFVPFTAQTRMSGIDLDGREIRKGAADAIAQVRARPRRHRAAGAAGHRRSDRARRAARRWSSPSGAAPSASST